MHHHSRSDCDVFFNVNGDFSGDALIGIKDNPFFSVVIPAWRLLTGEIEGAEIEELTLKQWCRLVAIANEDWRRSQVISFVEQLSAREFAKKACKGLQGLARSTK